MADIEVDVATLPEDVREKLAELDLELSEGRNGEKNWRCVVILIFIHNYPVRCSCLSLYLDFTVRASR